MGFAASRAGTRTVREVRVDELGEPACGKPTGFVRRTSGYRRPSYTGPFGLCPDGQIELRGQCVTPLTGAPPLLTLGFAVAGAARLVEGARAASRGVRIIREARTILRSAEFAKRRAAAQAGEQAVVRIGGRTITF